MTKQPSREAGWKNPDPAEIKRIIMDSSAIAVVGLSSDRSRPSNRVARYLIKQGFEVFPVNPRETEILGQKSYPDLLSIGRPIDIVDIFRKGEDTPPIVTEAIQAGAKYIWLQKGIISEESYRLASRAGRPIVMNTCLLKEHKRLRA